MYLILRVWREIYYRLCGFIGGRNERKRDGGQIGVQGRVRKVWYGIVSEKKAIEEDDGGHVYGVTPMGEEFSAAPLHMVL